MGVAAVILASKEVALANSLTPKPKILGSAVTGVTPELWALDQHQRVLNC